MPVELIGRTTESALLRRALTGARCVVVTGPVGVGKSSIVLRAVGPLLRQPRSPALLVDVRSVPAGASLLDTLGRELDVIPHAESIASGPVNLLVLDGCEEALDEVRTLAEELLRLSDSLRIVITSTSSVTITDAAYLPIRPLPRVASYPMSSGFAQQDAVRLFEEEAKQADPYFSLDAGDEDIVTEICNRCGGIPLLLKTAARHARSLSLDQLSALSATALAGLAPAIESEPLSRVSRAVAELSAQSRLLLTRAAALPGNFTLETLEALSGWDLGHARLAEALTDLVDASLLVRDRSTEGTNLEVPAIVGAAVVGEDGTDAHLATAVATHLIDVVARLEHDWIGPRQKYWQRRLTSELPMIEWCVSALSGTEQGREKAQQILHGLRQFVVLNNRHRWALRLLSRCVSAGDPPTLAGMTARVHLAYYLVFLGHVGAAREELDAARELARTLDTGVQDVYIAMTQAIIEIRSQRYELALELLLPAASAMQDGRYPPGQALEPLFMATFLQASAGDFEGAATSIATSDRLSTELESEWGRGLTRLLEGMIYLRLQESDHAEAVLEQALTTLKGLGDGATAALALELLSSIEASRGEFVRAVQFLAPASEDSIFFRHIFRELTASTGVALQDALGPRKFQAILRDASRRQLLQLASSPGTTAALGDTSGLPEPGKLPLTTRELEVARLVALGYSNPRIAARLVISRRTAEGHVQRIMRKGGFGSRTEAGVWYARLYGAPSE